VFSITDSRMLRRRGRMAAFAAATLLLASCKGTVTTELAVELPADPGVRQVLVNLTGLEFRAAGETTAKLEFSEAESVELTSYADGDTLRLFTDEELPEGTYTGVRLLFDDENEENGSLLDATGAQFPIIIGEGGYAAINVKIEDDENSDDSLTLTLDLRQSLTFDDDADQFTLTPVLRSVPSDEAGLIQGPVDAVCASDRLDTVAAVYLFQGADVLPDDRDGNGVEPYATTPVLFNSSNGTFSYAFRFLPAGQYTLALACDGNEEIPSEDDDLGFKDAANVTLEEDETLSHSI
jgi:hypothetical protein